GLVLEPAVFDDRIRIRVTASDVPDTIVVVADFTVFHDQIRSTSALAGCCCVIRAETGDRRVLDNQSAARAEVDSVSVAEHNAVHGKPSQNDLVRRAAGPGDGAR